MNLNKVVPIKLAILSLLSVLILMISAVSQGNDGTIQAKADELSDFFRVTNAPVDLALADRAVNQQIGDEWRVADWNDLRAAWRAYKREMQSFFQREGYIHVTRNNEAQWGYSGLWYVFSDQNGDDTTLFHQVANLGENELTLGAWFGNHRVLAVHEDFDRDAVATRPSSRIPEGDIEMEWELSTATVEMGKSFTLDIRLYGIPQISHHGGVSISFPGLRNTGLGTQGASSNNYKSLEADVSTVAYTTGLSRVKYYDAGDTINTAYLAPTSANHLVVETDDPTWTSTSDRTLRLKVTPKLPGQFAMRIRSWACYNTYSDCLRNPTYGQSIDQQGWATDLVTVNVVPKNYGTPPYPNLQQIFATTYSPVNLHQADAEVKRQLGIDWRVADWNDIQAAWQLYSDETRRFLDGQGYLHITRDGNPNYGTSERWFIVGDHNRARPRSFDAIDQLGGQELSLGARNGDMQRVLAVRTTFPFNWPYLPYWPYWLPYSQNLATVQPPNWPCWWPYSQNPDNIQEPSRHCWWPYSQNPATIPDPGINMQWGVSSHIVETGDSITLDVYLSGSPHYEGRGGISISFPTLETANATNTGSSNIYTSEEADIVITKYTSGVSAVKYYQPGDTVSTAYGQQIPTEHLMVETNDQIWPTQSERVLKLRISPKTIGTFPIRIRSWLCPNGYQNCIRDPGYSTITDQQGWNTDWVNIAVIPAMPRFADYFTWTDTTVNPAQANETVQNQLGDEWRVADWNDLRAAWATYSNEMRSAFEGEGYIHLTRNGKSQWGNTEQYYVIGDHNGAKPGFFQSLDQLGGHEISLGSWFGNYKILAVRRGFYGR